jgi:small nuclear ribonucleoprotein D3
MSLKGVGIPVKLLHEAEGHTVTVELKTGETYRGELFEAEDNWNVQLKDVTATARDGRVSQLEHIFIRGSRVSRARSPRVLHARCLGGPSCRGADPAAPPRRGGTQPASTAAARGLGCSGSCMRAPRPAAAPPPGCCAAGTARHVTLARLGRRRHRPTPCPAPRRCAS